MTSREEFHLYYTHVTCDKRTLCSLSLSSLIAVRPLSRTYSPDSPRLPDLSRADDDDDAFLGVARARQRHFCAHDDLHFDFQPALALAFDVGARGTKKGKRRVVAFYATTRMREAIPHTPEKAFPILHKAEGSNFRR